MLELLTAFVALAAVLSISYFRGRSRQQDALSRALAAPDEVARLYLRHAPEMDAYWLHARFANGRKQVLAAPWALAETLELLERRGLRLDEEDARAWARHIEARTAAGDEADARAPGQRRWRPPMSCAMSKNSSLSSACVMSVARQRR